MFNAHFDPPLTTAIAAGWGVRVGDSLMWRGLSRMTRRSDPHPIDRGVPR
jgi:hypothetical protein